MPCGGKAYHLQHHQQPCHEHRQIADRAGDALVADGHFVGHDRICRFDGDQCGNARCLLYKKEKVTKVKMLQVVCGLQHFLHPKGNPPAIDMHPQS